MRNKRAKVVLLNIFLAALVLVGCGGGGGGGGQGSSQSTVGEVSVSPSTGTYTKGTSFTRTVEVKNVNNSYYIAFDMVYDPAVVAYLFSVEGSFLGGNDPDSTNVQAALENGAQGRVVFGLTRLGGAGASGSGTLLILHFKAVGPGTTSLSFSDPKGFMDSSNNPVSIDAWKDGTVTVQ